MKEKVSIVLSVTKVYPVNCQSVLLRTHHLDWCSFVTFQTRNQQAMCKSFLRIFQFSDEY